MIKVVAPWYQSVMEEELFCMIYTAWYLLSDIVAAGHKPLKTLLERFCQRNVSHADTLPHSMDSLLHQALPTSMTTKRQGNILYRQVSHRLSRLM